MLADRMMTIAGDPRMQTVTGVTVLFYRHSHHDTQLILIDGGGIGGQIICFLQECQKAAVQALRGAVNPQHQTSVQIVQRVTTGETGAAEFPIDGEQMLVAFSPIRGTQWSLVIQIPKADYNHFINGAMFVAILSTMAVLVVSILLVLRLARSISNPVKRVTDPGTGPGGR